MRNNRGRKELEMHPCSIKFLQTNLQTIKGIHSEFLKAWQLQSQYYIVLFLVGCSMRGWGFISFPKKPGKATSLRTRWKPIILDTTRTIFIVILSLYHYNKHTLVFPFISCQKSQCGFRSCKLFQDEIRYAFFKC